MISKFGVYIFVKKNRFNLKIEEEDETRSDHHLCRKKKKKKAFKINFFTLSSSFGHSFLQGPIQKELRNCEINKCARILS